MCTIVWILGRPQVGIPFCVVRRPNDILKYRRMLGRITRKNYCSCSLLELPSSHRSMLTFRVQRLKRKWGDFQELRLLVFSYPSNRNLPLNKDPFGKVWTVDLILHNDGVSQDRSSLYHFYGRVECERSVSLCCLFVLFSCYLIQFSYLRYLLFISSYFPNSVHSWV